MAGYRFIARLCRLAATGLICGAALAPALAQTGVYTMNVDLNNNQGALKKPGLGSLFGVSGVAGGLTDGYLYTGALLTVSASQGRPGENGSNLFSTERVAPLIRGKGIKMICRFNDLLYNFAPYQWDGLAVWDSRVDAATRAVSQNYKDVVLCIAPFNEPDNKFGVESSRPFMTDTALPAGNYDDKVNWLWTRTVRRIRAIDGTIPIMGPNWENYRPWERNGADQTRMRNFLSNAIATSTVPDYIGWHSLGASPGDMPLAITDYYRPLENELQLPGRPKQLINEEYGGSQNYVYDPVYKTYTGDFEGVPGTMLKHMAELERYGVDYGSSAIYGNGGLVANTVRYPWVANGRKTGGWFLMNWYRQMTGYKCFVNSWRDRAYQKFDGIASYDASTRTATVLVGGSDDAADIKVFNVAGKIGSNVRVRVDCAQWETYPNEPGRVNRAYLGGDPHDRTLNTYDKTFTCDASGHLVVPLHRIEGYNAYRILVSPTAAPASYPGKYEAENASVVGARKTYSATQCSAGGYVGGIDGAGSYAEFTVSVASRGLYALTVRHARASSGATTHILTVNGQSQGVVNYPVQTNGWSDSELRTVTRRVALEAGTNVIRFAKGDGYAELDFIDLQPDTHQYEAEFARLNNVNPGFFRDMINVPNYVGSIDQTDSWVEFQVEAPKTGTYTFQVGYANGTTSNSTHSVSVNGTPAGSVTYVPTGGWLGSIADPNTVRKTVNVTVSLNAGMNTIRLTKGTGYAELEYAYLYY